MTRYESILSGLFEVYDKMFDFKCVVLLGGVGVWFMHCHLELHTGWGLKTAFVVEDGPGPEYSVLPPPKDLPPC